MFSSCWCLFFICLVMLCISMYIIAMIFLSSLLFFPQPCSCLLSTSLSFHIHLPSLLLSYILTVPLFSVCCIFFIVFHTSPVASNVLFLSCQILGAYLKRLSSNVALDFTRQTIIWYLNWDMMTVLLGFGMQTITRQSCITSKIMVPNFRLPVKSSAWLDQSF